MLFADVVGSTALIQGTDAESAMELLAPAVALMEDAVRRYGGTVAQRNGDGIMAIFGVPFALCHLKAGAKLDDAAQLGKARGMLSAMGVQHFGSGWPTKVRQLHSPYCMWQPTPHRPFAPGQQTRGFRDKSRRVRRRRLV